MDRRTKERMDVQLTCYIGARRFEAQPMRAFTENVSRTGMLMRWMEGIALPSVDEKLTLDIQLPENSDFGPRLMRCNARVVRVRACRDKAHEVALQVLNMRFVKSRKIRSSILAAMPVGAQIN